MATLCLTCLCLVSWQLATYQTKQAIHSELQQQLPSVVNRSIKYADDLASAVIQVKQGFNQAFQALDIESSLLPSVIKQCHVTLLDLSSYNNIEGLDERPINRTQIIWPYDRAFLAADIHIACQTQWWYLIGQNLILTILLLIGFRLLPKATPPSRLAWLNYLQQQGHTKQSALTLTKAWPQDWNDKQEYLLNALLQTNVIDFKQSQAICVQPEVSTLTLPQIDWLLVGLSHHYYAFEPALTVAKHPDSLQFDIENSQVFIRGIAIKLNKTPLLYYFWYAQLKQQNQAWFTNPASNKTDHKAGAKIAELMQLNQGHPKAINELLEHGLRSKTLDQNRNKIKEELQAALGEKTAQAYLFEARRDPKTARYQYQLKFDTSLIQPLTTSH